MKNAIIFINHLQVSEENLLKDGNTEQTLKQVMLYKVPRMTQSKFPGVGKKLLTATGSAFKQLTAKLTADVSSA
jgi:hypothetical protein